MITAEYAAGFFDGEGWVGIDHIVCRSDQYTVRVALSNTDLNILQLFQIQFDGKIYSKQAKPHWKVGHQLVLRGEKAIDFLNFIKPHVKVKRSQVELALEFWDFHRTGGRNDTVFSPVSGFSSRTIKKRTPETISKEALFKEEMGKLNQKGIIN